MMLKDKKAFYKVCFDSMQVGILVCNSKKEIVLSNNPLSKIVGCSTEDLFGKNTDELFNENSLLDEFIKHPGKVKFKSVIDDYIIKKDFRKIPVELSFGKIEYEKKPYFKILITDITERKNKEIEIDNLNIKLGEQVEIRNVELENAVKKLKASLNKEKELNNLKTKFITLASHEFKTPLSAILTSSELIVKYADLDKTHKRDEHLAKVKMMITHLNGMIDSLLTLENIESGEIIPSYSNFKLSDLINEIITNSKPLLLNNQKINFNNNYNEIIFQDANILKIIISNILYNAIKYSSDNSKIQIEYHLNEKDIQISIEDNGIGIPEDEQSLIFKRFFRARNVGYFPGTGIGLNIVKGYVNCLKGTISFKSVENKGTTFYVQLPKIESYE
jgi:PAS domain S-box-containing protein